MCQSISLRVLISINSTMIIISGYHGIRLYETEYNLMIYVDIDIAKLHPFAIEISSDGEILIEPFKFTNDYDVFYLLLSKLAPLDHNSIIIGLKSTAHYGDNLVGFLNNKNFKVYVLNPLSASAMRKNNLCHVSCYNKLVTAMTNKM